MTQVPMTLTEGRGQRPRSNFPKNGKNQRTGHISEAISPTDIILGTKIQPNKAHFMTQVPMTLTFGQGHKHLGHWMRIYGLTLVPSMKSVGEIASEIYSVLWFFTYFLENLTLTLGQGHRYSGH